jgi:hypothetical protein
MVAVMQRSRRNLLIAIAVGLISELWPIPGAILAAVVFLEGIHSSAPIDYVALTFVLNFVLFAGLAYAAAAWLSRSPVRPISTRRDPVKGVIYTESELEEFKRQGRR